VSTPTGEATRVETCRLNPGRSPRAITSVVAILDVVVVVVVVIAFAGAFAGAIAVAIAIASS
jgi:hypothetical protein